MHVENPLNPFPLVVTNKTTSYHSLVPSYAWPHQRLILRTAEATEPILRTSSYWFLSFVFGPPNPFKHCDGIWSLTLGWDQWPDQVFLLWCIVEPIRPELADPPRVSNPKLAFHTTSSNTTPKAYIYIRFHCNSASHEILWIQIAECTFHIGATHECLTDLKG